MSQTMDGASLGEALDAFLGEHGRCWRVSGEDLETHEDDAVVRVLCPGYGASVTVSKKR